MAHGEGVVTPITASQIDRMIATLRQGVSKPTPTLKANRTGSKLTQVLRQTSSPLPETAGEIARVQDALAYISPDVKRGNGSVFDINGAPAPDYWLGVVWAIASLQWSCGEALAREWSQKSSLYDRDEFVIDWSDYDPAHPSRVRIGSLFMLAKAKGWTDTPLPSTPAQPPHGGGYTLLGRNAIMALPTIQWRLKKVLPQKGLAAIYGPSGSGKTFLALDLGMAIGRGGPWFNIRTTQCPVTLVMLEGAGGLQGRVHAWELQNKALMPDAFKVISQSFELTAPGQVAAMGEALPKNGVVIIDTLNRAAPTADENSSQDMGTILQSLKQLEDTTGGLVVVVHHTGKDAARGMRGHSSLHAALDAVIEVKRNGDARSWGIAKAKDGEDGGDHAFTLEHHVLGTDADGEDITGCAVKRGGTSLFQQKEPSGRQQKAALAEVKKALHKATAQPVCFSGLPTQRITVADAVTVVAGSLVTVASNKRNYRASALVQDLLNGSHLRTGTDSQGGEWLWS